MFSKNKLGFYITIFFSIIVSIFLTILSLIPHMFFRSYSKWPVFTQFHRNFHFFFFFTFHFVDRNCHSKSGKVDTVRCITRWNVAKCGEMWRDVVQDEVARMVGTENRWGYELRGERSNLHGRWTRTALRWR